MEKIKFLILIWIYFFNAINLYTMDIMKRLLRILCTMVIVFNIINASPKLYLYLLPFENINDGTGLGNIK